MDNLMLFSNEELSCEVRILNVNGVEYFVGKDVAAALGYSNSSKAVIMHCKKGIKRILETPSQNGKVVKTETTLIPESDVYRLIIKSKLPQAEKFEEWVMETVLPQIRKTGGYVPISQEDDDATIMAKAYLIAQKTLAQKEKLVATMTPKAEFADAILVSDTNLKIGDFSKLTNMGSKTLFKFLRDEKIFMANNLPYEQYKVNIQDIP